MSDLGEQKEIVKLEKKLKNSTGGSLFIEEVRKLEGAKDINGLEFKLKDLAKHRQAIISTRNDDEGLMKAKKVVKNLNAPYTEQLNQGTAKSRFIGLLLQEFEGFDSSKGLDDGVEED